MSTWTYHPWNKNDVAAKIGKIAGRMTWTPSPFWNPSPSQKQELLAILGSLGIKYSIHRNNSGEDDAGWYFILTE